MVISKRVSRLFLPWLLHAIILMLVAAATTASAAQVMTRPGCPERCGDVSIPYPFGIGEKCSIKGLEITCNDTHHVPPVAFIGDGNIEITNISLAEGQLRVKLFMASQCSNESGWTNSTTVSINLSEMYKFSKTQNRFFAVGCETLAYIQGTNEKTNSYASGCVSFCSDARSVTNGTCDGIGCCQTSIPEALTFFNVSFGFDNTSVWGFNPCSYAFLAEQSWYNFSSAHLSSDFAADDQDRVPVVIDWAIRDNSSLGSACNSTNSVYFPSDNGEGYRCKCLEGYEGNPYLTDGCYDIDECNQTSRYHCHGTCINVPGGYECSCPHGMDGDAKNGPCTKPTESFPLSAKLAVGISGGLVILVVIGSFMLMTCQKRKHEREKEMFFDRNGGLKLYQEMRSRRVDTVAVFSKTDLERATNNFDDDRVLGAGGRGMVYKGVLDDGREVAIKKSKVVDEDQTEEFVNEIIILSQINHKNVVRLFGCCLEVDVPMLVYEFVPNGTLYDAIHRDHKNQNPPMPLAMRLNIATESAEALAYLHSSVTRSIVHGDVKSLNILLDDKGRAKVSDFGASQLVPMDESGFVQFMQGTLGYLDPESLLSHRLTDKSDVYSFGVVLLELITGKKAIYSEGSVEKKSLASSFLVAMKENKLQEIIDEHVQNELGGVDQMLREVCELARQCLSVGGDERPSMKEVAERLHGLARYKQHPWEQQRGEETQGLLVDFAYQHSSGETSVNQSLDSRLVLDIDIGGR